MRDMLVGVPSPCNGGGSSEMGVADTGAENRPDTSQLAKAVNAGKGLP